MGKIIQSIWGWIRRDGFLHAETCALIAIAVSLFLPWWAGGVAALLAGIAKELWDLKHGVASWHDIICDLAGIAVGVAVSVIQSIT